MLTLLILNSKWIISPDRIGPKINTRLYYITIIFVQVDTSFIVAFATTVIVAIISFIIIVHPFVAIFSVIVLLLSYMCFAVMLLLFPKSIFRCYKYSTVQYRTCTVQY